MNECQTRAGAIELGVAVAPRESRKEEGKVTLFMPDSELGSYGLLIFGVVSLALAVNAACTGEAWSRFGVVVYRAEEPRKFWRLVALQYLVGVCFVGYSLYKVYGH